MNILLTNEPPTNFDTVKAMGIVVMLNDNDPNWHYIAKPSTPELDKSIIEVLDEDWELIGTL